jgi:hypothetical protein
MALAHTHTHAACCCIPMRTQHTHARTHARMQHAHVKAPWQLNCYPRLLHHRHAACCCIPMLLHGLMRVRAESSEGKAASNARRFSAAAPAIIIAPQLAALDAHVRASVACCLWTNEWLTSALWFSRSIIAPSYCTAAGAHRQGPPRNICVLLCERGRSRWSTQEGTHRPR